MKGSKIMKKNKKQTLLSLVCGAIALTAAVFGVSALKKDATTADAATLVFEGGQFAQEYAYGQSFELPDSVKIEYNGKEYDAREILESPQMYRLLSDEPMYLKKASYAGFPRYGK